METSRKKTPIQIFDLIIALTLVNVTAIAVAGLAENVIEKLPIRDRHKIYILLIWVVIVLALTVWFLYSRIKNNEIDAKDLL
jgi:uncharacterized BrkB/YihY/UPF0761 family membrane protein